MSVKVVLNGKTYNLTEFDDARTLKYILTKTHPGTIPSYFRIIPNNDGSYNSKSFLEDLRSTTIEDMKKPETLQRFKSLYPSVFRSSPTGPSTMELWAGAWLSLHSYDASAIPLLMDIDPATFANESRIRRALEGYKGLVDAIRRDVINKSYTFDAAKELLSKSPPVKVLEHSIIRKIVSMNLEFAKPTSLMQVFDAIAPSRLVPFVMYYHDGKSYYKLHDGLKTLPDDSWMVLERDSENRSKELRMRNLNREGVLVLHVFSLPKKVESSKQYQEPNKYTTVYWYPGHLLETSFAAKHDFSIDELWGRILTSTDGLNLTNQIYNDQSVNAQAVFDINIGRESFTDFLLTDRLASYFCFFDESIETTVQKKRVLLFFEAGCNVLRRASAFRITATESEQGLKIGISNAENEQQVLTTIKIFSRLLGRYQDAREGIEAAYRLIYAKSIPEVNVKEKKSKKNLKTGPKLQALREALGEEVISNTWYSKDCPPNHQPTVITKEEAEILKKRNPNLVLEIKGVHLMCDHEKRPYPNFSAKGNPCCYIKEPGREPTSKKAATYIVGPDKPLDAGRKGELRILFQRILELIEVKKIALGKSVPVFPYLRIGVEESPSSFVSCLAYALQKSNSEIIKKALDFLKLPNAFSACRQELYDTNLEWVREALSSKDPSVHPAFYCRLFELALNINIIMFSVDKEDKDIIFLPRHQSRYLRHPSDPYLDTVVIFVNKFVDSDFVQCELLIRDDSKIRAKFKDDVFVDYLRSLSSSTKLWKINELSSELLTGV